METVLTIDDDNIILKVIERVLDGAGYKVVTALGGQKGIDKAIDVVPDVILLDRNMPEVDGYEVLTQLKDHKDVAHIPVIMLTGESNMERVSDCFEVGAVDYIVKPFDDNNFLLRLRKVLRDAKRG